MFWWKIPSEKKIIADNTVQKNDLHFGAAELRAEFAENSTLQ